MPPKIASYDEMCRQIEMAKRYEKIRKNLSPGQRGRTPVEDLEIYEDQRKEDRHNRGKSGRRADLGFLYVRSQWEADYARFLNFCIQREINGVKSWEYEPTEFEFHLIKRGSRFYKPDFKVYFHDGRYEWHEVKGWMNQESKTKLSRFDKYYPEESRKLILITSQEMKLIANQFSTVIPHWGS